MKTKLFTLLLLCSFLLVGCIYGNGSEDNFPTEQFEPVYMARDAFENSVAITSPKASINAGKIYLKDNLLFVTDVNKGFQIYNYANPENPIATAYINFPGATDMAIRNNSINVNQATDLVTIDFNSSTNAIIVTNRIKNVFPVKLSPLGNYPQDKPNQVVTNWIKK